MYFSDGGHENVFLALFLLHSPRPKNYLVSQSKLFDTIVRHSIEISENVVLTYQKIVIALKPSYHEQRI